MIKDRKQAPTDSEDMAMLFKRIFEPAWLRDLEIRPALRLKVREEVETLHMKDRSTFYAMGSTEPERKARQLRQKLGGIGTLKGLLIAAAFLSWSIVFFLLSIYVAINAPSFPWGFAMFTVLAFVQVVPIWLFSQLIFKQRLTPYYATILRRHDIVVCPKCGYHGSNLASGTICTECGLEDPLAE